MEYFEVARRGSIADEMAQQSYELKRIKGAGPSRHVAITVETTRQVEGSCETQLETSA